MARSALCLTGSLVMEWLAERRTTPIARMIARPQTARLADVWFTPCAHTSSSRSCHSTSRRAPSSAARERNGTKESRSKRLSVRNARGPLHLEVSTRGREALHRLGVMLRIALWAATLVAAARAAVPAAEWAGSFATLGTSFATLVGGCLAPAACD